MKKFIAAISLIILWFGSSYAIAADAGELIRGNAKFNAVVIVLAIIFAGLIVFLFRLDKRISKLESGKGGKS